MSSKKILTIGLGGATCGGKSTLAGLLGSLFGKSCQKLNQDDFYFPETYTGHTFIPEFNHINWELESAFDNAKLVKTVGDIVQKSTSATAHCQFFRCLPHFTKATIQSIYTRAKFMQ